MPTDTPTNVTTADGALVVVRRSTRRRRTVTAFRERGTVVVCIPAAFTRAQEREWVETMTARLDRREAGARLGDAGLQQRADELRARYLPGCPEPHRVTWSARQQRVWGTCTPATASIRLSTALQRMPQWVVDYVLLHELAHLIVPAHSAEFWALLDAYPHTERARGYLEGYAAAQHLPGQALADADLTDDILSDETPAARVQAARRG